VLAASCLQNSAGGSFCNVDVFSGTLNRQAQGPSSSQFRATFSLKFRIFALRTKSCDLTATLQHICMRLASLEFDVELSDDIVHIG
jgi:hypothetical protein